MTTTTTTGACEECWCVRGTIVPAVRWIDDGTGEASCGLCAACARDWEEAETEKVGEYGGRGRGPRRSRSRVHGSRSQARLRGLAVSARDAAVAMDLALTLGSAARLAVDSRVTERTFLDLARSLFRNAGGSPGREGRPTSRDGWTDLVEAYGGVAKLAGELEVDRRTLARWRSGATEIPPEKAKVVVRLARSAKVKWRARS